MLLKQSVITVLMASISLVVALPAPSVVNLSVRDEDYGTEYKRSLSNTFVCKRDDQSLSCLRKKSDDALDQSKTANI